MCKATCHYVVESLGDGRAACLRERRNNGRPKAIARCHLISNFYCFVLILGKARLAPISAARYEKRR